MFWLVEVSVSGRFFCWFSCLLALVMPAGGFCEVSVWLHSKAGLGFYIPQCKYWNLVQNTVAAEYWASLFSLLSFSSRWGRNNPILLPQILHVVCCEGCVLLGSQRPASLAAQPMQTVSGTLPSSDTKSKLLLSSVEPRFHVLSVSWTRWLAITTSSCI